MWLWAGRSRLGQIPAWFQSEVSTKHFKEQTKKVNDKQTSRAESRMKVQEVVSVGAVEFALRGCGGRSRSQGGEAEGCR